VLVVAPAVSVEQQELDRVEFTLRANDFSPEHIASAVKYTRLLFDAVRDDAAFPHLEQASAAHRQSEWFEHVSSIESPADLQRWRTLSYDPAETLGNLAVPTLAIYGERDTLVPPERNADRLKALLERGGSIVKVAILPNAGHNLETFGTLKGDEWKWPEKYWVWPRKSPELLQVLQEWLPLHIGGR
jgi:pimeloyl-ACP methyl ester carboxylesterase